MRLRYRRRRHRMSSSAASGAAGGKAHKWLEGLQTVTRMLVEEPFMGMRASSSRHPCAMSCRSRCSDHIRPVARVLAARDDPARRAARTRCAYIRVRVAGGIAPMGSRLLHDDRERMRTGRLCDQPESRDHVPVSLRSRRGQGAPTRDRESRFFSLRPRSLRVFRKSRARQDQPLGKLQKSGGKTGEFPLLRVRTTDCVGTPAQIGARCGASSIAGVDQVMFLSQAGTNST